MMLWTTRGWSMWTIPVGSVELRRGDDPAEHQAEAEEQVLVVGGTGQQAQVVEEDHQRAQPEQREHEHRHPGGTDLELLGDGRRVAARTALADLTGGVALGDGVPGAGAAAPLGGRATGVALVLAILSCQGVTVSPRPDTGPETLGQE